MQLGVYLQLLMGPSIAIPVSSEIIQLVKKVEVANTVDKPDVFQITFSTGKSGSLALDYPLLNHPLLKVSNRVKILVYFGITPQVLIDGIIINTQFNPNNEPGKSVFVVTGEDVSYVMNMKTHSIPYPNVPTQLSILKIISSYSQYGLIPDVSSPLNPLASTETDVVHTQRETDLTYLQAMAKKNHFVFYMEPGLVGTMAYWGPVKNDILQESLSVNMGPDTNVKQISFSDDSKKPTKFEGYVMDRLSNQIIPIQSLPSTRVPIAREPSWLVNMQNTRTKQFMADGGLDYAEAMSQVQAEFENSVDDTLTARGDLDPARYGSLIRARKKVKLRGAGDKHNGIYDVKSVTTTITRGSINQNFVLSREGTGSTLVNVG